MIFDLVMIFGLCKHDFEFISKSQKYIIYPFKAQI